MENTLLVELLNHQKISPNEMPSRLIDEFKSTLSIDCFFAVSGDDEAFYDPEEGWIKWIIVV